MAETSYVTEHMRKVKGQWAFEYVAPPIAASDIRKWAIATHWPETPPRVYWDENYAKGSRWGGVIAPPDFNPFAWPIEPMERPRWGAGPNGEELKSMNGGQVDTYGVPMRPGDVIRTRSRLMDWNEKPGRLGLTLYARTEIEWLNQNDEMVKRRVSTSIRY